MTMKETKETTKTKEAKGAKAKKAKKIVIAGIVAVLATILFVAGIGRLIPSGKIKVNSPPTEARVAIAQNQKKVVWKKLQEITAPAQWSKEYSTPSGLFKIMPAPGEKAEVLFSDGKYFLIDSSEQIDMGAVSEGFRLRGIGKETVVFLYEGRY